MAKKVNVSKKATKVEVVDISKESKRLGPLLLASHKAKLQRGLAWGLLGFFGATICATIAMVILNGLYITDIDKEIVVSLIGATIAETGGMLILILQSVFGGEVLGGEVPKEE